VIDRTNKGMIFQGAITRKLAVSV